MKARATDTLPLALDAVHFGAGGRSLVDGVSAIVADPGVTVLLGPNGAGKTLLLRLSCGLLRPHSGSVRWAGVDPRTPRIRIGYVPQHPAMLRRSARANLGYAVARLGLSRAERERRIAEGLECAGLEGRGNAAARLLSGGERQRLAIARARIQRPAAMLLDEPGVHLDPAAALAIEHLVGSLRDSGTKILLTTHDLSQARRIADDVLFLHQGRLLEHAPASRFFSDPVSDEGARFIAGELLAA